MSIVGFLVGKIICYAYDHRCPGCALRPHGFTDVRTYVVSVSAHRQNERSTGRHVAALPSQTPCFQFRVLHEYLSQQPSQTAIGSRRCDDVPQRVSRSGCFAVAGEWKTWQKAPQGLLRRVYSAFGTLLWCLVCHDCDSFKLTKQSCVCFLHLFGYN